MGYKPAYIWNGTAWDQIGNQAVASLNDYALLAPVVGQNLTNTTLTSASINSASVSGSIFGTATLAGTISGGTLSAPTINSASVVSPVFTSPEEVVTISSASATGTVNFDCLTQGVLYYTSNAGANFTLNFRGNGSTTLNNILSTGQSITCSFLNTNGATAYYPNAFQVDGASVTPKWAGSVAPSSGNASSIDAYSFTIIKTANATFTVLAGAVQFK